MRKPLLGVALAMTLVLSGCGYNTFQTTDEQVKASWSEVVNQYQRRADLVPNLVNTVKGEAKFEQDTLTQVVEARAKATSIQASPEPVNDPAAVQVIAMVFGYKEKPNFSVDNERDIAKPPTVDLGGVTARAGGAASGVAK